MGPWLAIEGLPGAGKTTTARLVAAALNVAAVLERSDLHPFLAEYYEDPEGHAMETELVFMALHLHAVKRHDGAQPLITDFSPAKDLVFAELAMPAHDRRTLRDLYAKLWVTAAPTVAMFLDVPPAVCLERTRERGRVFEQSLTEDKLTAIRAGYEREWSSIGRTLQRLELTGAETREAVATAVARIAIPLLAAPEASG